METGKKAIESHRPGFVFGADDESEKSRDRSHSLITGIRVTDALKIHWPYSAPGIKKLPVRN